MQVSNSPFLTANEFKYACTTLERLAAKLSSNVNDDSADPRLLITFSNVSVLRIEKVLRRNEDSSAEGPGGGSVESTEEKGQVADVFDEADGEEDDDDDDTIHPHDLSLGQGSLRPSQDKVKVRYDICLSPSYNVPVLYIDFDHAGPQTTGRLDKLYDLLVPPDARQKLKSASVMGGLTMTNHPITGLPCFFIHPCETINHLQSVLQDGDIDVLRYMVVWLSYAGPPVGLHLPKELASLALSMEKGEIE